jgi:hypothetical protein
MSRSICQILARKLISIVRQPMPVCCYSLPLDSDATIGIDLHEWLFLLVTGQGE